MHRGLYAPGNLMMEQATERSNNLSRVGIAAMAAAYLLAAVLLLYLLSALWPGQQVSAKSVILFHRQLEMSAEVRLMWLVLISSALGSYIHTVTSFTLYAGHGRLDPNWMAWYVLRPAISAALALIFYFSLRAGLFSGASADQTINPFGISAISGMVGMFSKQAAEKLNKVFDTIFA
jgi:hypothetical protein